MRFLVFSDSHGRSLDMMEIISRQKQLDGIFHLGDGRRDLIANHKKFDGIPLFAAVGNCDPEADVEYEVVDFDGVRILYTHGHLQYVKHSLSDLLKIAKREEVQIALFGHTHQPHLEQKQGIWLMNPGSIGKDYTEPFATLEIQKGQVIPNLFSFKNIR